MLFDKVLHLLLGEGVDGLGKLEAGLGAPVLNDLVGAEALVRWVQEDGSMIVLASIGDYDTLVPGDVDTTAEVKFLSSCTYPDIELLLVGHHGSKKSTCDAWLDAIAPDAAIISVGYNSYGHPTEEALLRLTDAGMTVYRTDMQGNILITVD